eukprot:gene13368-13495_t
MQATKGACRVMIEPTLQLLPAASCVSGASSLNQSRCISEKQGMGFTSEVALDAADNYMEALMVRTASDVSKGSNIENSSSDSAVATAGRLGSSCVIPSGFMNPLEAHIMLPQWQQEQQQLDMAGVDNSQQRAGKSLLCKLLAEQTLPSEYTSTVAVRVQELSRQIGQEHVKVQLWDVAGNHQYQQYWELLAKDVDGVLLVTNPGHPEQERELEAFYLKFAQPNSLTMKQCMVVGITVAEGTAAAWSGKNSVRCEGLTGKLRKLVSGHVCINPSNPEAGFKVAADLLDKLLTGCVTQKKDRMERAMLGD